MIIFSCQTCGENLEASEEMFGKVIECPTCKAMVNVRGVSTEQIHPQIVEEKKGAKSSAKVLHFFVSILVLAVIGGVVFYVKTASVGGDDVAVLAAGKTGTVVQGSGDGIAGGAVADDRQVRSTADTDNVERAVKEYDVKPDVESTVGRELLGKWRDPADGQKSSIVICRIKNNYFLQRYMEDNLVTQVRLTEKESELPGRNFEDTSAGLDYKLFYRVTDDGKLEIWQDSNCTATAEPIE